MNAELDTYDIILPQKEGVIEGVRICVKCGSPETTILKDAIYCRICRNFQLFTKKQNVDITTLEQLWIWIKTQN